MNYAKRREQVFNNIEERALVVLYSGIEQHVSADEYAKFEANRNFFYLTGLRREKMALVMNKARKKVFLFIEKADPTQERWYGRKTTVEEAKKISGIEDVYMIDDIDSYISSMMANDCINYLYMDTYRYQVEDLADYNEVKAKEFIGNYPAVMLKNLFPVVAALRMEKDEKEIALTKEAIKLTDLGLKRVMKNLKPGNFEYEAQADFEYEIFRNGADGVAFHTIAGSGINGTMLHYDTNRDVCEEDSLILLDLGARLDGYNADITRTYPVSGKYTKRQKEVYDIVLEANRTIAKEAKPGMTLRELNTICSSVLAKGLIRLGLIEKEEEVGKYYMHGVSHHLGIDVHDVNVPEKAKLTKGCIITDEPGLYIDEWEIGIRIEDDLLITEDGCVCLSEDIIRTTEEIEQFMEQNR